MNTVKPEKTVQQCADLLTFLSFIPPDLLEDTDRYESWKFLFDASHQLGAQETLAPTLLSIEKQIVDESLQATIQQQRAERPFSSPTPRRLMQNHTPLDESPAVSQERAKKQHASSSTQVTTDE
jgi:hypothetical protein